MKSAAALFLIILLASVPSTFAQPGGLGIGYGRSWPRSMAVDSARGVLYVDGMSGIYPPTGFSFGIINASTHAVERVLPLNVTAGEMAIDDSNGDVYVAGSNSIEVFDGRTQAFVRQIGIGVPVFYILYDAGSGNLFISNGLNKVFEVDPQTGALLASATVGNGTEGLALDQSTGELYVADYLSNSISVLNAPSLALVTTIALPAPCYPSQIALNQKTRMLYSTTGVNTIDVVDSATNRFVQSVVVAPLTSNSTSAIALDDHTNSVFVLTGPGTTITQVDGSALSVVGRFSVSSDAYELAVNQATGELYVTVYHQVSVFNETHGPASVFPQEVVSGVILTVAAVVAVILARRAAKRRKLSLRMSSSPLG